MKQSMKLRITALIIGFMIMTAIVGSMACSRNQNSIEEQNESKAETYLVTFVAPDHSILYIDKVKKGEAAEPPANMVMPQGYIFSYWDKDFSNVTEEMTIYAVCQQIPSSGNVLTLGGSYASKGEQVTVPLQLCGDVCLCAFDIRVVYDKEVLDFVEFSSKDSAVDANCMEEKGVIYLNYGSRENTTGEVDLTDLVFTVVGEAAWTSVTIEVMEVISFDENYDFYVPECTTISAIIRISEK